MSTMPPIRREVLVDADPATAFDVFTTRLGRWWPLATHSVHGAGGTSRSRSPPRSARAASPATTTAPT